MHADNTWSLVSRALSIVYVLYSFYIKISISMAIFHRCDCTPLCAHTHITYSAWERRTFAEPQNTRNNRRASTATLITKRFRLSLSLGPWVPLYLQWTNINLITGTVGYTTAVIGARAAGRTHQESRRTRQRSKPQWNTQLTRANASRCWAETPTTPTSGQGCAVWCSGRCGPGWSSKCASTAPGLILFCSFAATLTVRWDTDKHGLKYFEHDECAISLFSYNTQCLQFL